VSGWVRAGGCRDPGAGRGPAGAAVVSDVGSPLRSWLVPVDTQPHQRSGYTFAAPRPVRPWLRYRYLVLTAFAAVALTFFALFRIDLGGGYGSLISFRHDQTWRSVETLLVTAPQPPDSRSLEDSRASALARLFAQIANSDSVRAFASRDAPLKGRYEAWASAGASDTSSRLGGPFLSIRALASSPGHAVHTAVRVSRSLRAYLEREEGTARIRRSERVRLYVVSASSRATLVQERKLVRPLVALGVVLALLALAAVSRFRTELR
jgi:hypothetical protein